MAKVPQNLLITFIFLSYSLLTKNALHCKQKLFNITFCSLLAKAKLHNTAVHSLNSLALLISLIHVMQMTSYSQQFH